MGILVYKALPVKLSSLHGVRQGGIPKHASAHQHLCKANFHSARQNGKNEDGEYNNILLIMSIYTKHLKYNGTGKRARCLYIRKALIGDLGEI